MSRFPRSFAQSASSYNVIVPSPRLAALRCMRLISLLTMASWIFLAGFFYLLILATGGENGFLLPIFMFPLVYLFNYIICTFYIQKLKRLEPLRLVAAQGDQRLLASEQPQADANVMLLPGRINTYPVFYILTRGFLYIALVMLFISIPAYLRWYGWHPFPLEIWLLVLISLCAFVLMARFYRCPIEVTQQGIWAREGSSNKAIFMFWDEVCLFACYPDSYPLHDGRGIVFELSSASHTVYWTCRQHQRPFLTGFLIPLEEHNAQMQALCSLVVANTGLPLYDLGKASRPDDV